MHVNDIQSYKTYRDVPTILSAFLSACVNCDWPKDYFNLNHGPKMGQKFLKNKNKKYLSKLISQLKKSHNVQIKFFLIFFKETFFCPIMSVMDVF